MDIPIFVERDMNIIMIMNLTKTYIRTRNPNTKDPMKKPITISRKNVRREYYDPDVYIRKRVMVIINEDRRNGRIFYVYYLRDRHVER